MSDTGTDWAALADKLLLWSDAANVFEDTDDDRDDLRAAAVGLRRLAQLDTAIGQQVAELRAIHHPQWASPDGGYTTERRDGYTPVGCAECYPHDGSWPCVTAMVADDLAAVLGSGEQPESCRPRAAEHKAETGHVEWQVHDGTIGELTAELERKLGQQHEHLRSLLDEVVRLRGLR